MNWCKRQIANVATNYHSSVKNPRGCVYGVQIAGIRIRGLIADTLIFWFWYGLLVCVYGVQILGKLLFLNPPIKQLVKHWADLRSFFLIEKIRGGLLSSSIVHRSPEWRDWIYFHTSTVLLCNPYFDAFALLVWATSVKFLPRDTGLRSGRYCSVCAGLGQTCSPPGVHEDGRAAIL